VKKQKFSFYITKKYGQFFYQTREADMPLYNNTSFYILHDDKSFSQHLETKKLKTKIT